MPLIGKEQLLWLMEQMQKRAEACGLMVEREAIEPFPSVFRRARAGCAWYENRSMRSLTKTKGFTVVEPAPEGAGQTVWANLN
jgi:hypothetical protein